MPTDHKRFDRIFNPKTVVVVGAKKATNYSWLRNMLTVKGKLYSVQLDENEIPGIEDLGVTNYKSMAEIPEPIDYVLVAVPRNVAPIILADAIKANAGGVAMFTSGFAETDDDGRALQEKIRGMALEADLPLIGPNCMGIFSPAAGVRQNEDQYHGESGPVGFIGQSGTHTVYTSTTLNVVHGVKLAKAVSFGNAAVLEATDYLDYFAADPKIEIIGMYIEGVKDGRRFVRALREAAAKKPVLIWKGGQTEQGARAAASHTASLAAPQAIWDTMIRQAGAIRVDSLDELVDTTAALVRLGEVHGDNGGLMCMTGGESVVITDTFGKQGLNVPRLTQKSYDEFATFFNVIGGSYQNPLDVSYNFGSPDVVRRLLRIMNDDENTDFVGLEMFVSTMRQTSGEKTEAFHGAIAEHAAAPSSKPFFTLVTATSAEREAVDLRQELTRRGILAFPSFQRAAVAYKKALDYWRAKRAA